ncbi:MAG: hypothetical protein ACR2NR_11505 [Solirubrobacteraceae bacterium]
MGVAVVATILVVSAAQATSRRSRSAHAQAISAPTLGVRSIVPNGAGFGRVRPRTVSYGGDPTSFVSKVTWRRWGGAQAIGHGMADWVWPGWCVACGSVELPATVVAFGRTTCQGHAAYSLVEWYFPSRGMSVSRRLAGTNLCGRRSPPPGSTKELKCGHVSLRSNGSVVALAGNIDVFDPQITCTTARRFVTNSGAGRHVGRNARFTVDAWWCGSELSMDLGGPQSFSCVEGDFTNVSFDIEPFGE